MHEPGIANFKSFELVNNRQKTPNFILFKFTSSNLFLVRFKNKLITFGNGDWIMKRSKRW